MPSEGPLWNKNGEAYDELVILFDQVFDAIFLVEKDVDISDTS